jgi:hypothetical protein
MTASAVSALSATGLVAAVDSDIFVPPVAGLAAWTPRQDH